MRIGVFTDSWKPYTSGVVRSIETFVDELEGLGHEVHIFAPGYPRHTRREGNVYRFVSLPALTNPGFRLGIPVSPRLRTTAAQLGLDVVHVHAPFLLGQLGARLARRLGLPLVFTYHTLYHRYAHYVPLPRGISEQVALRWSRDFSNRCDLVIAPTSGVRDFLGDLGVTAPVEVVPTGIYPERFRQGDPAWLGRTFGLGPGPVLLYVGRLAREKNLPFLLRVLRRVRREFPGVRLVLVGDGPERAELREAAARLSLSSAVVFAGQRQDRELAHCYAGADLFTFPSVTETQGIVLVEAQAAGLPAVAIRAVGTADMVVDGRDGFLCEASEAAFAGAVLRLLRDRELRAAMARAAWTKADGLAAPLMARRLADLYRRVAGERRRPPVLRRNIGSGRP